MKEVFFFFYDPFFRELDLKKKSKDIAQSAWQNPSVLTVKVKEHKTEPCGLSKQMKAEMKQENAYRQRQKQRSGNEAKITGSQKPRKQSSK